MLKDLLQFRNFRPNRRDCPAFHQLPWRECLISRVRERNSEVGAFAHHDGDRKVIKHCRQQLALGLADLFNPLPLADVVKDGYEVVSVRTKYED